MWLTLLIGALTGCSSPEPCDSNEFICDTAAYWERKRAEKIPTPDPTDGTWIEVIRQPGCNGSEDTWTYSARVRGSTNGGSAIDVWASEDAGGFNEAHQLPVYESGDGFEELLVEVRDEADAQQYQPSVATTYVCGETDTGRVLTFVLRVYGSDGQLADCAIFSTEPNAEAAIDDVFTSGAPEPNTVRNRDEITADNCRTWSIPGA